MFCFLYDLERGGVERAAVRLLRAWRPHAEVAVALASGDAGPLAEDGLRLIRPPRRVPPRRAALWMLLWLPVVLRRERPDILFCPGNSYALPAMVARLALGRRCPPIVLKVSNPLDRADLPPRGRRVAAWWARWQGRRVARFVATSAAMARETEAMVGGDHVALIANPAFERATFTALAALPPREADAAGRHFLAIGRLAPQKDFALLIAAFARGAAPGDRLTILGEGPLRAALMAQVAALGLAGQVALPGFAADVAPWLAQADALVLSSRYEGLPAAVLEALAAARPVIATDCCVAMRPLLAEAGCGTLVPIGDAAALAAAIAGFAPGGIDAPRARAVAERHVTDRVAAAYLPLFRAVVQ